MADTVLIAPADLLGPLHAHPDLASALVFPDTDTPVALEVILLRVPRLVVLEQRFAATSRGVALIERLRLEPRLHACEIRIVAHQPGPEPAAIAAPASAVAPRSAMDPAVLDAHGTRRAPRIGMPDRFEITLDGRPARLVDVSIGGAQVLTVLALKPGQRVRLALPVETRRLRCAAIIQWAKFEMPREGPRYRAGVRLLDPDTAAITAFIEAHTTR